MPMTAQGHRGIVECRAVRGVCAGRAMMSESSFMRGEAGGAEEKGRREGGREGEVGKRPRASCVMASF